MIVGSRRSSGVIEQMIASMRPSSRSSTSALRSSFGTPGSIADEVLERPHLPHLAHLLEEVLEREVALAQLLLRLRGLVGVERLLGLLDEVSTSPMPRIRLAMRSGWNGSKSSSFSPTPTKRIGRPVTSFTDSAAPPRASPSSFVSTTPVRSIVSANASATFTAS